MVLYYYVRGDTMPIITSIAYLFIFYSTVRYKTSLIYLFIAAVVFGATCIINVKNGKSAFFNGWMLAAAICGIIYCGMVIFRPGIRWLFG